MQLGQAIGFGSHRWSPAESRRAPTDREVRAALFGLDHFRVYLQHRPFTLVTDCSAITWLVTSQHLSSTTYRYALRMMEFSMTLRWRKGTEHTVPDALSRLPQKGPAGPPLDTSFPDDTSTPVGRTNEPVGPVLDRVPLQSLAPGVGMDEDPRPVDTCGGDNSPDEEPTLDGVQLAALGATEVNTGPRSGRCNTPWKFRTRWTTNGARTTRKSRTLSRPDARAPPSWGVEPVVPC